MRVRVEHSGATVEMASSNQTRCMDGGRIHLTVPDWGAFQQSSVVSEKSKHGKTRSRSARKQLGRSHQHSARPSSHARRASAAPIAPFWLKDRTRFAAVAGALGPSPALLLLHEAREYSPPGPSPASPLQRTHSEAPQ
jgi:hypothetical protein